MFKFRQIFEAARMVGWSDEDIRSLSKSLFNTYALRKLTTGQCGDLLNEIQRLSKGNSTRISPPNAVPAKIRALWIAAYNLGVIDDRCDAAMWRFIERQIGKNRSNSPIRADDSAKVIRKLEAMIAGAGVKFETHSDAVRSADDARTHVAEGQIQILRNAGFIDEGDADLALQAQKIVGKSLTEFGRHDWHYLQNNLGAQIQKLALEKQKHASI